MSAPNEQSAVAPAELLYVFADRLLPKGNMLNGYVVPGTDARVVYNDLAIDVVVAALWGLRERGAIRIESSVKKVLFVSHHEVHLTRTGEAVEAEGLAALMFRNIGNATELGAVLLAVFGRTPYALQGITHLEFESAATHGYLKKTGNDKGERVPEAIERLQPAYDAFAAAWSAFQKNEAELFDALQKRTKTAITMLAPPESSGNQ